jgi:hypothetical protein
MKFFRNRQQFNLERELRAGRPQPRADFVESLAAEVRSRPPQRTRIGRVGLAFALSGLIVVALASFGGVGYASSAVSHAVKKPAAKEVQVASAASAQYGQFKPKAKPKAKPTPASVQQVQAAGQAADVAPAAKSSQLPFTGLALWIPLAGGLLLIAFGLALRTRGRRHSSGAH